MVSRKSCCCCWAIYGKYYMATTCKKRRCQQDCIWKQKHTCEVSLSLGTLDLAVQSVAQHEREATPDDLHSPHQHTQQCCFQMQDLHPPATGRQERLRWLCSMQSSLSTHMRHKTLCLYNSDVNQQPRPSHMHVYSTGSSTHNFTAGVLSSMSKDNHGSQTVLLSTVSALLYDQISE